MLDASILNFDHKIDTFRDVIEPIQAKPGMFELIRNTLHNRLENINLKLLRFNVILKLGLFIHAMILFYFLKNKKLKRLVNCFC